MTNAGVEADLGDLVEQVCQATEDLGSQPGKLRGRRLADAVDALNALGGPGGSCQARQQRPDDLSG